MVGLGGAFNTPLVAALAQLTERLGSVPGEAPRRHIGAAEIAQVREVADLIERRAHVVGGGVDGGGVDEFHTAMQHVQAVKAMLDADRSPDVNTDLYVAAGWLFRAVGFMAFDTSRVTIAQDLLWAAQECATYAHCASLEARVLGTRARQDAWSGNPSDATRLLVRALRLPDLTHLERSMLHALQARALGRLGRLDATLKAVDESDEELFLSNGDDLGDRPWVGFFDQAHQQGDTGRALLDAALHCGAQVPQRLIDEGMTRHRGALASFDVTKHRRSATFTTFNLAATQMVAGAPDEALTVVNGGVGLAAGIRSRRVDEHMRLARDTAARLPGNRSAEQAGEVIGLALVSADQ